MSLACCFNGVNNWDFRKKKIHSVELFFLFTVFDINQNCLERVQLQFIQITVIMCALHGGAQCMATLQYSYDSDGCN